MKLTSPSPQVIQNANHPVIIAAPSTTTSAFGVGLALVGDINKDGFQDFAIGAPYENDMKGAVYLYHGSYDGIRTTPTQTITATSLGSNLGGITNYHVLIPLHKDILSCIVVSRMYNTVRITMFQYLYIKTSCVTL